MGVAYKTGIFEDWVPNWLRVVLVFAMNIPISMVMGTYIGIMPILVGETGNMQEVFTAANYASFGGMAVAFPIFLGLKRMFKPRTVLLTAYISIMVLLYVATITDSPTLIILIGFLCGAIRMVGGFELIVMIMPILSPNREDYVKYTFFYPQMLALGQLGNYVVSILAFKYEWRFGYYAIMALQLIPILLVLIFVHNQKVTKSIKVHMFDWFSFILSALLMIITVYVAAFGKVKDWFDSKEIIAGVGVIPLIAFLLYHRLRSMKRPFIRIDIFWNKHFLYSILFMFLICMFYSSAGLQSAFYTTFLQYNVQTQAELNLLLMPGIILGAGISYWWFKFGNNFKGIYLLAVSAYLISHIQFYFLINPHVDRYQMITPILFRGIGIGISYIGISTYGAKGFSNLMDGLGGVFWLILIRSLVGPLFFGTFYNNVLNNKVADYMNRLRSKVDFTNPEVHQAYQTGYQTAIAKGMDQVVAHQMAIQNLYVSLKTEATMLALQYIFGGVIIAGMFLIAFTLLVKAPHLNRRKAVKWRRIWRGEDLVLVPKNKIT